MTSKIIPIQKIDSTPLDFSNGDDKHVKMLELMMADPTIRVKPQKNLTVVPILHNVTRTQRVAMILAPEWAPIAAPYGLARLTALARESGFACGTWDVNIECYNRGPQKYWSNQWDWKWASDAYETEIHPQIEDILQEKIEEIVAFAPTIIGFTVYYCNNRCTTWLVNQLKSRLPNAKIIFGGPSAIQGKVDDVTIADHVVQGEGELMFLKILEAYESGTGDTLPELLVQDKAERINLDEMPRPDYSDLVKNQYLFNAVNTEFSRGCIAKCQFCSETTFWKYRGRQSNNVLDEVEYYYNTFGITHVMFIDSLVNGNLKEIRAFAQGIVDRGIKIKWNGYCRNDGRMDYEFLKVLRDSGCTQLAFGVESGSQKVLNIMKKNVLTADVERNFRDLAKLGMLESFTTWFMGFPGEELTDVAQTLTMLWRIRDSGAGYFGFGTCNLSIDTPIYLEKERFGVSEENWGGNWRSKDWKNTIVNRVMRFKSANIMMNHFRRHHTQYHGHHLAWPTMESQYTLEYDPANWVDYPPYEIEFDYNIVKANINPLADGIINEMWPLFRIFWLAMGPYKMSVTFDQERDRKEFGQWRALVDDKSSFDAVYSFEIDADGNWHADFDVNLVSHHFYGPPDDNHENYGFVFKNRITGNWTRPVPDVVDI